MKEIKGIGSGLKGLTTYSFDGDDLQSSLARVRAEKDAYRNRYGSEWRKRYDIDKGHHVDYDWQLRVLNEGLYHGSMPMVSGTSEFAARVHYLYHEREREVYGSMYDELVGHAYGDERVARLLVEDSVKTGRWKELPEELHGLYKDYVERGCVW